MACSTINYGPLLPFERKGLSAIRVYNRYLFGWESISLALEETEKIGFTETSEGSPLPAFYKSKFTIEEPLDTFLYPKGFSKGFVLLNGVNLGRFYNMAGPQKTLYVPSCYLKQGKNELIIFDSDGTQNPSACFVDKPINEAKNDRVQ